MLLTFTPLVLDAPPILALQLMYPSVRNPALVAAMDLAVPRETIAARLESQPQMISMSAAFQRLRKIEPADFGLGMRVGKGA